MFYAQSNMLKYELENYLVLINLTNFRKSSSLNISLESKLLLDIHSPNHYLLSLKTNTLNGEIILL